MHLLDPSLEFVLIAELCLAFALVKLQLVKLSFELTLSCELPFLIALKDGLLAIIGSPEDQWHQHSTPTISYAHQELGQAEHNAQLHLDLIEFLLYVICCLG